MKLQERYGDHIFFAEVCGRKNVIRFSDMTCFYSQWQMECCWWNWKCNDCC